MANGGPPQRLDTASALSPTVAAARLGFAIILVATFVWGIWISSEADGVGDWPTRAGYARGLAFGEAHLFGIRPMPAAWDFLSVTATPIGFAFLLLVRAETLRPTLHAWAIANAGLAAAIAVAVAGFGTGIWSVVAPPSGSEWGALAVATVPLALGVTLFGSAAALRGRAPTIRAFALTGGLAIMVAAAAMGIRSAFDSTIYGAIPTSVLTAAWPAGVGLLLLVTGEETRVISRFSGWGVALGGLLTTAVLAAAIWFAVDVYDLFGAPYGDADRFLPVIVQMAILPLSIAALSGVVAFGLKGREVWAGAPALGWTASVLLAVAAAGFAVRLIAPGDSFGLPRGAANADLVLWAVIGGLITPLAIAALVAVEAQRCRQLRA